MEWKGVVVWLGAAGAVLGTAEWGAAAAQPVPADVAPPMGVAPGSWRVGLWPEGGIVHAGVAAPVLRSDSVKQAWWGWAEASATGGWTVSRVGVTRRQELRPGLTLAAGVGVRRRRWAEVDVVDYGPTATVALAGKAGPADAVLWCDVEGGSQFRWGVMGSRTLDRVSGAVAWHADRGFFASCAGEAHPRVWLGGWMSTGPWRLGASVAWTLGGHPVWLLSGPHPLFGWTWGLVP